MVTMEFSLTGYIIMTLVMLLGGAIGATLAHKKSRSPLFWGIICTLAPFGLFIIGGMRAPGEPLPPIFQREKEELAREAAQRADRLNQQDLTVAQKDS